MSEYQYIAFRAIDGPVDPKNLEYMHRQSSRAEITPWSFENEYHYGDFRGDAIEMLRRGYDIYLHYANFGIRNLSIRFPHGLPNPRATKPYIGKESLQFVKDKKGPGGCLVIDPYLESGELDDLWDIGDLLDRLVPLRAEILEGDLRPLYLAHLAVAGDGNHDPDETVEAPVTAGLEALTDAQRALADLFGLDDALLAAAARESPRLPSRTDSSTRYAQWVRDQPEKAKNDWLTALMAGSASAVRGEILAKYRAEQDAPAWPTAQPKRTITQLHEAQAEIARETKKRDAAQAARQRAKRLAGMAADPAATLRETEKLVTERTERAYSRVGELLAELREALAESNQSGLAEKQAEKLKAANPKLHMLTRELRRRGFVPK